MPVFPLARRLPAGASLEGCIEIPLPLAETSPYFPDLTLRGYEIIDIKGVQLMIGYWPAASQDLVVRQSEYASDLLTVSAQTLSAAPHAYPDASRRMGYNCSNEPMHFRDHWGHDMIVSIAVNSPAVCSRRQARVEKSWRRGRAEESPGERGVV